MNRLFLAASALAFLVGLAHSLIGEYLIFRRMRQGGWIPTNGGRVIGERHVRIIWASWHALTVFGWCVAAILFWLAQSDSPPPAFLVNTITAAMLAGSALVFIGTKARHPGWIGLLGVAVLAWLAKP